MDKLLIVDDDLQVRVALYEVLKHEGYDVVSVEGGEEAIMRLSRDRFSAVITDVKMPGMNGLDVLRSVNRISPGTPVLMVTAFGTVESAIEAMKEGAKDYILKPFSAEIIASTLKRVLSSRGDKGQMEIVHSSRKIRELLDIARDIAPTPATVLITGESGTGKELFARFIHGVSDRSAGPFVAVNCASIPDGLLESELFGHEKGAFTGAISRKSGKFEMAHGGTMLLDEVGEMGLQLQAKLLRVLQEREIDRVGGKGPVPVNIRVIATTNRDLRKEVAEGRFREDLFYRLNVFPIVIPPLRERRDDIAPLAKYFLKIFCERDGKHISGISEEAMELLQAHDWKGNVRELENVMERGTLIGRGEELRPDDLFYGGDIRISRESVNELRHGGTLKDMERKLIFKALKDTGGNKTKAAKVLGVSIRTLRNKLKEYSDEESIAL